MDFRRIYFVAALLMTMTVHAQQNFRFKHIAREMPAAWYGSVEAKAAADSVLKYQFPSGGWGKNQDWHMSPENKKVHERQEIWKQIHSANGVGATIDNGATTTEMLLLAKVYGATRQKIYRTGFIKGLNYLFAAQYGNGGWPQFYPLKPASKKGQPAYSDHITFNDNAIYNVMTTLRDIYEEKEPYNNLALPKDLKEKAEKAFYKGIDCILKCQIRKDGKLTVWCQQHDEKTFLPAPARSFELVSFTGSHETVNLLKLLMSLPQPSEEVITAVTAAKEWLEAHAIQDMTLEEFTNQEGKRDRRLTHQFGSRIWARYYDIDTEEPFVCDRDGIKQPSLEFIGYERRNGYAWYGDQPEDIIRKYPKWLQKAKHTK